MTEHLISVEMWFVGPAESTEEQFESFVDEVLGQIEALDREVTVTARLADFMAEFGTVAVGEDRDEEINSYLVDLRTALHAAGAATPGWPFVVRDQKTRELQDA